MGTIDPLGEWLLLRVTNTTSESFDTFGELCDPLPIPGANINRAFAFSSVDVSVVVSENDKSIVFAMLCNQPSSLRTDNLYVGYWVQIDIIPLVSLSWG